MKHLFHLSFVLPCLFHLSSFHDPFDAVAWCCATQLALLNADWPELLLQHAKAGMQTVRELEEKHVAILAKRLGNSTLLSNWNHTLKKSSSASDHMSVNEIPMSGGSSRRRASTDVVLNHPVLNPMLFGTLADGSHGAYDSRRNIPDLLEVSTSSSWDRYTHLGIIFRGLRVRMAVATGISDVMQLHPVTHRVEYFGQVTRRAQAVSELPSGGQILIDSETFKGINAQLNRLSTVVTSSVGQKKTHKVPGLPSWLSQGAATPRHSMSVDSPRLHNKGSPPALTRNSIFKTAVTRTQLMRASIFGLQQQGDDLEAGMPRPSTNGLAQVRVPSRFATKPRVALNNRAAEDGLLGGETNAHSSEGTISPQALTPNNGEGGGEATLLASQRPKRLLVDEAVEVVDCGVFKLEAGGEVEYNDIVQVLIPGLEERARFLPHIERHGQLTPGYLDAPATALAPLGPVDHVEKRSYPNITLVFCALSKYAEMRSINGLLARQVLNVYTDTIRRSLMIMGGYECQELEGAFMIAFEVAEDAVEWCLMVQELVMEVPWASEVLSLPDSSEIRDAVGGDTLWYGPRVKMGVYEGMPAKVTPHSTTGRADYFGPLVNRAARFCHAAAQGGQVIVSRDLIESMIEQWVGSEQLLQAGKRMANNQQQQHLLEGAVPGAAADLMADCFSTQAITPVWTMPQDHELLLTAVRHKQAGSIDLGDKRSIQVSEPGSTFPATLQHSSSKGGRVPSKSTVGILMEDELNKSFLDTSKVRRLISRSRDPWRSLRSSMEEPRQSAAKATRSAGLQQYVQDQGLVQLTVTLENSMSGGYSHTGSGLLLMMTAQDENELQEAAAAAAAAESGIHAMAPYASGDLTPVDSPTAIHLLRGVRAASSALAVAQRDEMAVASPFALALQAAFASMQPDEVPNTFDEDMSGSRAAKRALPPRRASQIPALLAAQEAIELSIPRHHSARMASAMRGVRSSTTCADLRQLIRQQQIARKESGTRSSISTNTNGAASLRHMPSSSAFRSGSLTRINDDPLEGEDEGENEGESYNAARVGEAAAAADSCSPAVVVQGQEAPELLSSCGPSTLEPSFSSSLKAWGPLIQSQGSSSLPHDAMAPGITKTSSEEVTGPSNTVQFDSMGSSQQQPGCIRMSQEGTQDQGALRKQQGLPLVQQPSLLLSGGSSLSLLGGSEQGLSAAAATYSAMTPTTATLPTGGGRQYPLLSGTGSFTMIDRQPAGMPKRSAPRSRFSHQNLSQVVLAARANLPLPSTSTSSEHPNQHLQVVKEAASTSAGGQRGRPGDALSASSRTHQKASDICTSGSNPKISPSHELDTIVAISPPLPSVSVKVLQHNLLAPHTLQNSVLPYVAQSGYHNYSSSQKRSDPGVKICTSLSSQHSGTYTASAPLLYTATTTTTNTTTTPAHALTSPRSSDSFRFPKTAGAVDISDVSLLPLSCITQRLRCGRWLWAGALHVDDLGLFKFKGVMGHHAVCSVTTQRTMGRMFNTCIKKSKGEQVQSGLGPLFKVVLSPHPEVTSDELCDT
ncbi:hypothetical protein CEUSTIGMA_g3288.t1 [Chlamydomonas eustigma]|uniref:Guanylate cyclase domain-containing protein n=1 Tax=Chlamydomonas eustigma TaxID=1157962 RepID=A0A250WYI3_9CHLO|nr:hypothetical protein CEUSTIGMA_g3288.t1 [Chlamydomonas eustigma]|eukprot:GAX75845.1 hypothetical protein CEUSTIGMA_g3288.t1 [Chlamydomonas eustigma]